MEHCLADHGDMDMVILRMDMGTHMDMVADSINKKCNKTSRYQTAGF